MKSDRRAACPDEADLVRLARGVLSRRERERWSGHVATCLDCQERLAEIEAGDELLELLRESRRDVPDEVRDRLTARSTQTLRESGR